MKRKTALSLPGWQILVLGMVAGVLVWLPFEDQSILIPTLLALPSAGLVMRVCRQRYPHGSIVCGLASGLAVAPAALLWMAFKTGVHGHGVADFTPSQIGDVIRSTPVWLVVGGLLGWGCQRRHSKPAGEDAGSGE